MAAGGNALSNANYVTAHYTQFGSTVNGATHIYTTSGTGSLTDWADRGSNATLDLTSSGSGSSGRWQAASTPTLSNIQASTSLTGTYYDQLLLTVTGNPAAHGSPNSEGTQFGSPVGSGGTSAFYDRGTIANATVSGTTVVEGGVTYILVNWSGAASGAASTTSPNITMSAAETETANWDTQPSLGSLSPTQWTVNQSGYTGAIPISNGTSPYTVSAQSGLPNGLTATVSGSNVTFTGTPTASGTFNNVQITAKDADGITASGTFTITINAAPTLGSLSPTQWTVNQSGYSGSIAISNGTGPFTVSAQSGLPTGLTAAISGTNVTFTGTPTAAGTFSNVQLTVKDAAGATVSGTFTITINAAPTLGSLAPTQWTVNQAGYTGAVPISNGTGPFTVSAQSNLPTGLTATITGTNVTFTGTPTATGTFNNVQITVKDAAGTTVSGTFTITINPALGIGTQPASATIDNGQSDTLSVTPSRHHALHLPVVRRPQRHHHQPHRRRHQQQLHRDARQHHAILGAGDRRQRCHGQQQHRHHHRQRRSDAGQPGSHAVDGQPGRLHRRHCDQQWHRTLHGQHQSNLPTGLTATITGTNVTFTGTPTATGTFSTVQLTVKDATGTTTSGTFTITINAAPTLGSLAPTQWTVNQSGYTGAIAISNGTGPFTVSAQSNLPTGLTATITGTNVTFTGTPTATGTFNNVQLTVKDAAGATVSGTFTITINAAPTLGSLAPTQWTVNQAGYTGSIPVGSGTGPFTVSAQSNLPTGLTATISGTNVTFTGTPTASGTFSNVQLTVKDAAGATVTKTFSITINPALGIGTQPASATIDNGQSDTLTVTPSGGTGPYSYQWFVGPSGTTSNPIGGATSSSYTASPGSTTQYWVQITDASGAVVNSNTATITVNADPTLGSLAPTQWTVNQSGYTGAIAISNGTGPFTVSAQSGLPTGLTATITGSNVTFTGTPTATGTFNNVQLTVQDATGTTTSGTFTITINAAPTLGSLAPTQWTVNQSGYTGAIAISNGTGPFTVSAQSNLPTGLTATITGSNVTFTGTPTATGTFSNVQMTVKDVAGATVSGTFTITINPAPTLGSLSPTQWTVNQAGYTGAVPISNGTGPFTVSAQSNLPTGLTATITGTNVTFTGTPTATGTFNNVQLTVKDAAGATVSGTFTITINPAPTLGSLAPTQWTVNQAGYTGSIPVGSGTGPFTVSAQSNLPTGLTATISGTNVTFTGTPTSAGTFSNVQITVQDAAGATVTKTFSITINPALGIGTQPASATIDNGQSDTLTVTPSGGTGPYSYQWFVGPSGTTTNPIDGATSSSYTASPGSTTQYWVQITDASGAVVNSNTATITVNADPTLGSLAPTQWTVNQAGYTGAIAISNGTGPFTVSAQSNLPTGLTATISGTNVTFTGTPTASGTFNNVQLTVQDATGTTTSGTFTITINAAPTLGSLAPTQWTVNQSGYTGAIAISNGTGPFTVSASPTCPPA